MKQFISHKVILNGWIYPPSKKAAQPKPTLHHDVMAPSRIWSAACFSAPVTAYQAGQYINNGSKLWGVIIKHDDWMEYSYY